MTPMNYQPVDVLVIGAGNAAANAALTAHEAGCSVAVLETAPEAARGGNSAFTGGAFRFVYQDVNDLLALDPAIAELDLSSIDFGTYTQEQYFDDMGRLTEYRCGSGSDRGTDRQNSYASALWLKKHGVKFQPALGRQAFKVDGKFRFLGWTGVPHSMGVAIAPRRDVARETGEGRNDPCCTTFLDGVAIPARRRPGRRCARAGMADGFMISARKRSSWPAAVSESNARKCVPVT